MPSFDWRDVPEDLLARYDEGALGYGSWRRLVLMLLEYLPSEQPDPFLAAFDAFLRQVQAIEAGPPVCRVFVSHQRADVPFAERIAYLAAQQGFEYWLDVHDPLLQLANRTALPPVVQSILIAAIIEMALLNCSHGITVQTRHAQHSRWVPYEFGRAKRRWLVSSQVASWFDHGIYAASTADYLKLGVCLHAEGQVVRWLADEWTRCSCPFAGARWRGGAVSPLPS